MEVFLNLISFEKIFSLPLIVYGPGLFFIFLLVMRAIRSLFSLRLLTAFTSLLFAWFLAVLLSHWVPELVKVYDFSIEQKPEQSWNLAPLNLHENRLA